MKTQLNIQEFATQILADAKDKQDYLADTREMVWIPDNGTLAVKGLEFKPTEHAHGQLAEHLKIPKTYYDRMLKDAPDLFGRSLRTWFDQKPARRMLRTLRGKARAFVSDRFSRHMDDEHFAEIVLPAAMEVPGCEIVSCGRTETNTHLKFKSARYTREVKRNDDVQFGIAYSNSEVGCGRLTGKLFAYRLVCLNGMVSEDEMFGAAHVTRRSDGRTIDLGEVFQMDTVEADAKATVLKLRDFTTTILSDDFLNRQVRKMQGLAEVEVKDPAKAVETLAKTHDFNDVTKASVLAHLIKGADLSLWGLANAVTRAAEDQADYDEATRLETVGGRMVASGPDNVLRDLYKKAA